MHIWLIQLYYNADIYVCVHVFVCVHARVCVWQLNMFAQTN